VFRTPAPSQPNPANAGKTSHDVTTNAVAPALPAAQTAQADYVSSGYRSIHYVDQVATSQPFMITTDNDTFFVSDLAAHQVKMYQIVNNGTNFVRSFGTGSSGSGAGQFNGPEQVAVVGNDIYVADFSNNRVQRFNKSTGASGTGAGQFSSPTGIVFNPVNGQLYVSDLGGDRIQRFTTAGVYQGQFGSLGSGNGQLNNPWTLAVDAVGYIYAADNNNNRVVKFDATGTFVRNIGTGVTSPLGVAVDKAGLVWVTDTGAQNVYAYDWQGNYEVYYYGANAINDAGFFNTLRAVAVTPPLTVSPFNGAPAIILSDLAGQVEIYAMSSQPTGHPFQDAKTGFGGYIGGVAFDSAENIYVTDSSNDKVWKYNKFGTLITSWGSTGTGNGQFRFPFGIAIDDSDNVYVVDNNNNRIQKFTASGGYLLQWGSNGSGNGQFNFPGSIAADSSFIYVTDESNHRVQKFGQTGSYVRQWGTNGTGNGQFQNPAGIAVDRNKNQVYVAEFYGNRIQQFSVFGDYISTISTPALNNPVGLTTDQHGNIFVADRGNNRVVQYNDNGTNLTTFANTNANAIAINPKNGQIYVGSNSGGILNHYGSPIGKSATIGVWRPSNQTFYLRNSNTQGVSDISATVNFATSSDLPVVGDWNGDGIDTPGIYRPSSSYFYLWDSWRNPSMASPDYLVLLGNPGDRPLAGSWDASGAYGVGTFRPSNGILYLRNNLTTGVSDYAMVLGNPSDIGVAGDWNTDGAYNAGIFRPSEVKYYLSNRNTNGIVFGDIALALGNAGDTPFTGDWTHSGYNGVAVFRPSTGFLYLKYTFTGPYADVGIYYGAPGDVGLGGHWGSTLAADAQADTNNANQPPVNNRIVVAAPSILVPGPGAPAKATEPPAHKFD
jgi:DNA-binding beta-propeller fold protein YncE